MVWNGPCGSISVGLGYVLPLRIDARDNQGVSLSRDVQQRQASGIRHLQRLAFLPMGAGRGGSAAAVRCGRVRQESPPFSAFNSAGDHAAIARIGLMISPPDKGLRGGLAIMAGHGGGSSSSSSLDQRRRAIFNSGTGRLR